MPGRRAFLIGAVSLLASRRAYATVGQRARIGYLASSDPKRTPGLEDLRDGLRKLGWVEGNNLSIDYRWAEKTETLRKQATELAVERVDLIFTWGTPATAAAKRATSSIPIVFTWVADPVAAGFVASLAHPAGNLTGMSNLSGDIGGKDVALIVRATPGIRRIAILRNPGNPNAGDLLGEAESAARARGLEYRVFDARSPADFGPAFESMTKNRMEAVVLLGDPVILEGRRPLADLALAHHLPSVYPHSAFASAGGLMSYGADPRDEFRHTATYIDKVLRGAKPADLPVELPTTMKLVLNLDTARALGISLPEELLVRADEVIQ